MRHVGFELPVGRLNKHASVQCGLKSRFSASIFLSLVNELFWLFLTTSPVSSGLQKLHRSDWKRRAFGDLTTHMIGLRVFVLVLKVLSLLFTFWFYRRAKRLL